MIPKKFILCFTETIGYSQRGRERISYECIFFLLLREISLELNFKRLEVSYYRSLQFFQQHLTISQVIWMLCI